MNIPRRLIIQNASLRDQCASDHFYGSDLVIEKALGGLEGYFGKISKKLNQDQKISAFEHGFLRDFSLLQHQRTEIYVKRSLMAMQELEDIVFERDDTFLERRADQREMLALALDALTEIRPLISDLKTCVIKNQTEIEFVTSDDPAVLTNRFYAQRARRFMGGSGFASSGVLLILPISPKNLFISYDGGVYTIDEKRNGEVIFSKTEDVCSLNELQYIKANSNIYFKDWTQKDTVLNTLSRHINQRPSHWHEVNYAVLDQIESTGKSYRVVHTEEERKSAREALIHLHNIPLVPQSRPSKLRFRMKPRYIDTGSGAGFIRPAEAVLARLNRSRET